jgi:hypothetical protein
MIQGEKNKKCQTKEKNLENGRRAEDREEIMEEKTGKADLINLLLYLQNKESRRKLDKESRG